MKLEFPKGFMTTDMFYWFGSSKVLEHLNWILGAVALGQKSTKV